MTRPSDAELADLIERLMTDQDCPFCDGGILRKRLDGRPSFHADDCVWQEARDYRCGAFCVQTNEQCVLYSDHDGGCMMPSEVYANAPSVADRGPSRGECCCGDDSCPVCKPMPSREALMELYEADSRYWDHPGSDTVGRVVQALSRCAREAGGGE